MTIHCHECEFLSIGAPVGAPKSKQRNFFTTIYFSVGLFRILQIVFYGLLRKKSSRTFVSLLWDYHYTNKMYLMDLWRCKMYINLKRFDILFPQATEKDEIFRKCLVSDKLCYNCTYNVSNNLGAATLEKVSFQ